MKKRFLKIAIIMIMFILVYVSIANAFSLTASMTPSSTTVAESTEFTITIKVSNLDVGTNGINALSGYLKYDKDVFESITDTSIDGLNGWTHTYTSDSEKITLTKATFVKTEEDVFQVTLKTKSGISGKTGKVEFTQIMASNTDTEISAQDISTEITIGNVPTENIASNNTTSINQIVIKPSNNTANTNVNNTNTNANVNNNTSNVISPVVNNSTPDDIVYAGAEDTVMYIMGLIIILAIFFYIKFERINKEIK